MKKNKNKLNGLKQYEIKSEAEMKEILWLIKEGAFKSVADYIKNRTLFFNGKAKDVYGKLINPEKLVDAATFPD